MPPLPSPARRLVGKTMRITILAAFFMVAAAVGAYLSLTLIIKGEDTVVVPDLVGKEVLYTLELLSQLGLNTRVKGIRFDDRVPKNHVIDQDPDAGAAIKRGRDVKIRVSRGPQTIVMPNLVGLSRQQSTILLTENGLCTGVVARMVSRQAGAGRVLAQNPRSGTTIARDHCVDLLVSRGAPSAAFAMPDLSGYPLETAIRYVEHQRLAVGNIRIVQRHSLPSETIVDQNPLPGERIAAGSRVDLTVNRSVGDDHAGRRPRPNHTELFRFTLDNGFLRKRVQVKMNRDRLSINLFDDFMGPGQEVWLLVPNNDNSTILVYVDGQLERTWPRDRRRPFW